MSLEWVDQTYKKKHQDDAPETLRPMYYDNLCKYPTTSPRRHEVKGSAAKKAGQSFIDVMRAKARRYGKRIAISLAVYIVSLEPHVGKYAVAGVTAYNMYKNIGPYPAALMMVAGSILPRAWTMGFFQGLLQSRTLMRELLEPYFKRIQFTPEQKQIWFRDRQGLLFGLLSDCNQHMGDYF